MDVADPLHGIEYVEHLGGHRLFLRFDDGSEGELDLRDVVRNFHRMLAPLANPKFVAQVRIEPGFRTLEWPGDIGLDPVVLYCVMKGIPVPGEKRPRTRFSRRGARVRTRSATRARVASRTRRRVT